MQFEDALWNLEPIFSPNSCKQYSRMRESGENARKMGKEEMENFSLRKTTASLKRFFIHA